MTERDREVRGGRGRRGPLAAAALSAALGMWAGCADGTGPRADGRTPDPTLATPAPVVFEVERLQAADSLLLREVERESFPGAALVVGVGGQVVHRSAHGRVGWGDSTAFVDTRATVYDLASLTKAVATASAVWLLVEEGRMKLDDPVSRYLPHFAGGREYGVTVRQLLTHTAGVRAGANPRSDDPSVVRRQLVELTPLLKPGADVLYSDIGYVVLWEAAERAAGEPLATYLHRKVWAPLGMRATRMGVPRGCPECAPTLYLQQGREPYRGGSYDLVGRRLGGVTGNAGLFSTADDLARFAAMVAAGGALDGVRIFREETVRAMLAAGEGTGTFTPGWVTFCREQVDTNAHPCGEVMALGHTGSTGTALWIEPGTGTWMVLLTNRVYLPRRNGFVMQDLRREVFAALTATDAE